MRVLVAHNAYQQRGGEDAVVEAEIALLRGHGHEVDLYDKHNDSIKTLPSLALVCKTMWSSQTTTEFGDRLATFRPDVVHVHNTFPLISPSIYWVAAKYGVTVVQTLHNFRLMCPQAMFLREGRVCEDCQGRLPWRGAMHGCYRGSRAQSAVLASMITLHRGLGTWRNKVTRYIALNEFCRRKFIEGGLPEDRVVVKPNFVDFAPPPEGRRDGFLFVGRLSAEKGVDVLARAAALVGDSTVRVAGSGPEDRLLENVPGVELLGALSGDEVRTRMGRAMALVLPSIWYENFPRTLVEAFGCGLPVIASRIGALAELVEDGVTGLLFNPGDAEDLAQIMRWAMEHPEELATMGRCARAHYETSFTADRNYEQLMTIYRRAMADRLQTEQ